MNNGSSDPRAMLPLSASSFHILLALAEEERHGYSIAKEVEAATGGSMRLGPGTLYRLIKEMVADGWIVEVEKPDSDDSRRRYYQLTAWGRRIASAEARRLDEIVRMARSRHLLEPAAGMT